MTSLSNKVSSQSLASPSIEVDSDRSLLLRSPTRRRNQRIDSVVRLASRIAALIVLGLVIGIFFFLIREVLAAPVPWSQFLLDDAWRPTAGSYQLLPMIAGSVAIVLGSMALVAPAGFLLAVYLHMFASRPAQRMMRGALDLLAGIPSVVYGFWGLTTVVPWINSFAPPGANLLAGILILGLMILPTMALLSDVAFAKVDPSLVQGAHALGLNRVTTLRMVHLPRAKVGLWSATLLSTGRAIGETMAVLMVCGNIPKVPGSLFEPIRTMTANIALEMGYAEGAHRQALFVTGLVLMGVVTALVLCRPSVDREVGA